MIGKFQATQAVEAKCQASRPTRRRTASAAASACSRVFKTSLDQAGMPPDNVSREAA